MEGNKRGEERCTEENKKRRKGTQKTAYLAKSTAKYQVSCSPALSETG